MRLIPAHAGKTRCHCGPQGCRRAHPRSRGENEAARQPHGWETGSSPLTRGKRHRAPVLHLPLRLIPAHAGKTTNGFRVGCVHQAHPRSRGENRAVSWVSVMNCGSSPLTRGKLQRQGQQHPVVGLIPAHAGKTREQPWPSSARAAHPRSRGENSGAALAFFGSGGSSPLTRGKLELRVMEPVPAGLIPAHAGKTWGCAGRDARRAAHPRSRGENCPLMGPDPLTTGSSPLTRGKRQIGLAHQLLQRLIPAHAGKTAVPWGRASAPAAHPRSRGENSGSSL